MMFAAAAAEGGKYPLAHVELPFAPIVFGIITFALLMFLLAVTWGFRNSAPLKPHAHGEAGHGEKGQARSAIEPGAKH